MRQRGLPIGLVGLIVILLAFIIWYGWSTQVAPYQAEQQAHQQQQEVNTQPPSEEELKAQLEKNKQLVQEPSAQKPAQEKPKPPTKPQPPKPNPSREVVEYWWKYTSEKSGK
ncbi:MAG: hypothetical protein ABDI19_00850 [Armatimonadota bacterium]